MLAYLGSSVICRKFRLRSGTLNCRLRAQASRENLSRDLLAILRKCLCGSRSTEPVLIQTDPSDSPYQWRSPTGLAHRTALRQLVLQGSRPGFWARAVLRESTAGQERAYREHDTFYS